MSQNQRVEKWPFMIPDAGMIRLPPKAKPNHMSLYKTVQEK